MANDGDKGGPQKPQHGQKVEESVEDLDLDAPPKEITPKKPGSWKSED